MNPSIQSLGAPPERHADRVVAEMLQHLAQTRAHLWPAISEAIDSSSDGSPKAQRKMAERIKRAGALDTVLVPGKRGRYTLMIYDWTEWDPHQDKEISLGDVIPERPWIACHLSAIESKGNGRREADFTSRPILFITHHALSRTAQRFGARTTDHLQISSKTMSAMADWRTYRNGNPRRPWNLERLARHRAAKLGYRVHRSRRRKGPENAGKLMLIHKASSTVLLGTGYTATVEMILKFMERERMQ